MSNKAAIHVAVQTALYNDKKVYSATQVMSTSPYSFNTPDLMRDFLLDVSHELSTDQPPILLNVDSLDLNACMADTAKDLESDIYDAVT